MSRQDLEKLIGGYATGTLTAEEQRALFAAALQDQELFDALAREETLRGVLRDPASRAHLLAALEEAPAPWYQHWWRLMTPVAAALLLMAGVALWREPRHLTKFVPPAPPRPVSENAPLLPEPPRIKPAPLPSLADLKLPLPMSGRPPARPAPAKMAVPAPTAPAVPAAAPPPPVLEPRAALPAAPPMRQMMMSNSLVGQPATLATVVTDPTGTPIPGATVEIRPDTGDAATGQTDRNGRFQVDEVPGTRYRITATSAGFRPATVSMVTPESGSPQPVKLELNVGSAAETVAVAPQVQSMASAGTLGGIAGGGGRGGRDSNGPLAPFEWHLLARTASGDREVPLGGTADAGARLILRVTPAATGVLRIEGSNGQAIVEARNVVRGRAVEEALPEYRTPGRVELRLSLTPAGVEARQQAPSATIVFNIR